MRRMITCACVAVLIAGSLLSEGVGYGQETPVQNPSPVLVELFTSEGCSTCPPADALLEQMDKQPIPGAQLIVMSEHVDYWDHGGWKDPYSSSSLTERQNAYVRTLGLKTAYTPQIIIDGLGELQRGDPQRINQLFLQVLALGKVPVHIALVGAETPAVVRGRIEVDDTTDNRSADVYVAIALDHAESKVSAGENVGKNLTHVAVVKELRRIAKVEKGKGVGQDFEFKLKSGSDPANARIIAFVQEAGPGKVLGAAVRVMKDRVTLDPH
jgi:hypothetical protein